MKTTMSPSRNETKVKLPVLNKVKTSVTMATMTMTTIMTMMTMMMTMMRVNLQDLLVPLR